MQSPSHTCETRYAAVLEKFLAVNNFAINISHMRPENFTRIILHSDDFFVSLLFSIFHNTMIYEHIFQEKYK